MQWITDNAMVFAWGWFFTPSDLRDSWWGWIITVVVIGSFEYFWFRGE
jgi:hypothetical protein